MANKNPTIDYVQQGIMERKYTEDMGEGACCIKSVCVVLEGNAFVLDGWPSWIGQSKIPNTGNNQPIKRFGMSVHQKYNTHQ